MEKNNLNWASGFGLVPKVEMEKKDHFWINTNLLLCFLPPSFPSSPHLYTILDLKMVPTLMEEKNIQISKPNFT